jgi:hypothetical protein
VALAYAERSDGRHHLIELVRPFHELDARWAAGASWREDNHVDAIYSGGQVQGRHRHRERRGEVYAGWSAGLVDGWVRRWSVGLALAEDAYAVEPGLAAPPQLPGNQKLIVPFVRHELLEDRYERQVNRNLVGRPEFFALGLGARVQLGRAWPGAGSTRAAWLYAGQVGRGFSPPGGRTLTALARVDGELSDGAPRRQQAGAVLRYYQPQGPHRLFYAALSADVLLRPDPTVQLDLGGDNGLRGYPLRYRSGTRRALLSVEQRFYTDLYLWQLFRIGGAVFADAGRAWGGASATGAGWLGNAGAGARIVSVRSAFGSVLHVDLAMPVGAPPDARAWQFLVSTKTSF